MLKGTGERYLPWLEDAFINYEHLHRYAYAAQFVRNLKVLDLACGEGYGSHLMSDTASLVTGIDIDEEVIRHAGSKYVKDNLQYKTGSITDVPIKGEGIYDVIVCYEAIEHIEYHEKCLNEVKRLLAPGGVFIVSTPDKSIYSEEAQFSNPFHVSELYFDQFNELLKKYFKNISFLGQRIYTGSNIWPLSSKDHPGFVEYVIDKGSTEYNFVGSDKKVPRYFIAMASDADLKMDIKSSTMCDIANDLDKQLVKLSNAAKTSQQELITLQEELNRIRSNACWRVLRKIRQISVKLFPFLSVKRKDAGVPLSRE